MCDPVTAALLIGGAGASFVGSQYSMAEDAKNAARIAQARNQVLRETQAKNQLLSDASRAEFDKRLADAPEGAAQPQIQQKQLVRSDNILDNIQSAAPPDTAAPDNAPKVVQSAIAKKMAEVAQSGTDRAAALGKLGGYGDFFQGQAIRDEEAGRGIGTQSNFIRGNLGLMPALQDYAEYQAIKPASGIGQILQALGGAAASAAGSGVGSGVGSGGGFFNKKIPLPNKRLVGSGGTLGGGV